MSFCSNCKLKIDWVDRWCPRCGEQLDTQGPEAVPPKEAILDDAKEAPTEDASVPLGCWFIIKVGLSLLFALALLIGQYQS